MTRAAVLTVPAVLALLLSGCGTTTDPDRINVVAAFYPLEFAAEQVAGGRASISSLTPPGTEPHDLELTPRQVAAIADADLVVYISGFQPAVDEAVELEADDRALDVSAHLPLLPAETAPEVAGEVAPEREHDDHDATDPHVWLDPTNMATIADRVADRLAAVDPAASVSYAAAAARFAGQLRRLDREWARGTADCRSRDLVVSHDAFGYLAHRYDFTQVGIAGLSAEAEPGPATVAAVADFARANGVETIYYETLVDPAVARTVADEIGVGTAVLDPIEGVEEGSDDTYLTLMRANLATVRAGQGCS